MGTVDHKSDTDAMSKNWISLQDPLVLVDGVHEQIHVEHHRPHLRPSRTPVSSMAIHR